MDRNKLLINAARFTQATLLLHVVKGLYDRLPDGKEAWTQAIEGALAAAEASDFEHSELSAEDQAEIKRLMTADIREFLGRTSG